MSKRLQVLMDEAEWREIRKTARSRRMTVAEWVRQALRGARSGESLRSVESKLAAVHRAALHRFPTGDIEQMNEEIERGYVTGRAR